MKLKILYALLFTVNFCVAQVQFTQQSIPVSSPDFGFKIADIDLDGDSDFLLIDFNEIVLYENTDGFGTLSEPQVLFVITENFASSGGLSIQSIGDVDGDNDSDILISIRPPVFGDPVLFRWYENDGTNSFGISHDIPDNEYLFNSRLCDLDNDGDLDILQFEFGILLYEDAEISWFENLDGLGDFADNEIISFAYSPVGVTFSDFDTDGDLDIIVPSFENGNFWIENIDGEGNFGTAQQYYEPFVSNRSPQTKDIDHDGDVDVLMHSVYDFASSSGPSEGAIEWLENTNGLGDFAFKQTLISIDDTRFYPTLADFDNDGDEDVFYANEDSMGWFEYLDEEGNYGVQNIISNNVYNTSPFAIDMDADGDLDVVLSRIFNGEIIWYQNMFLENYINGTVTLFDSSTVCGGSGAVLSNIKVTTSSNDRTVSTFTNESGTYALGVPAGEYSTVIENLPDYFSTQPSSQLTNFGGNNESDSADFCIEPNVTANDVNISIYPSIDDPRPGFETTYQLVYHNKGTTIQSGTVSFEFDDSKIQFLSASETVDSQTLNSITFDYLDLTPFESRTIDLLFNVFPPPTANIDDILISNATITPVVGDETELDNSFTLEQVLIGSYDPNDINVLEGDEVLIDDIDNFLHYVIRFQNTGTASAINVRVDHTLDVNLDYSTLELQSLSHMGRVEITNFSDIQFYFDNINLPDSTSDEPNSHGYIAFKIKPRNDIEVGDLINGIANIYFDFNPPIITNAVSTEIVDDNLSLNEFNSSKFSIYPNPVYMKLVIKGNSIINEINIIDINGRRLDTFLCNDSKFNIDVSFLSQGMYFLEIKSGNVKQVQKFIKN